MGFYGSGTYVEEGDSAAVTLNVKNVESVITLTKSGTHTCNVSGVQGTLGEDCVNEVLAAEGTFTRVTFG